MGVGEVDIPVSETNGSNHIHGPLPTLSLAQACVRPKHFLDLSSNTNKGVQPEPRLLRDQSNACTADSCKGILIRVQYFRSTKKYGALKIGISRLKTEKRAAERGLPGAGLTNNAQRCAFIEFETDTVDSGDTGTTKASREIAHPQQRWHAIIGPPLATMLPASGTRRVGRA